MIYLFQSFDAKPYAAAPYHFKCIVRLIRDKQLALLSGELVSLCFLGSLIFMRRTRPDIRLIICHP